MVQVITLTEFHIPIEKIIDRIYELEHLAKVAAPRSVEHGILRNSIGGLKKFVDGFYIDLDSVHKDIIRLKKYRDDIIASKKQHIIEYNEMVSGMQSDQRVNAPPIEKLDEIELVPQAVIDELNWAITIPEPESKPKPKKGKKGKKGKSK